MYVCVFLNKPDLSSLVAWLPYAYLPSMPRLLTVKCKARNAQSFRPRKDDNTIIYLAPFEILILNHASPISPTPSVISPSGNYRRSSMKSSIFIAHLALNAAAWF